MAAPAGSQGASDSLPRRRIGRGKDMHPAANERCVESPSEVKNRYTCVAVLTLSVGMSVGHAVLAYV